MPHPITGYKGKAGAWTATRSKCEGKGKTKEAALADLNDKIEEAKQELDPTQRAPIHELYKDIHLHDEGEDGFLFEYTPISKHGKPQRTRLDAEDYDSAVFESAGLLDCPEDDLKRYLQKRE